ncbi:hypothetical protein ABEW19_29960 [Paenibacillus illinoisensis]|uniref:hypothetical protein n=1 Tax=Paenibacillus illinoisensis TaxID=59845 RepID=UPI003D2BECE1
MSSKTFTVTMTYTLNSGMKGNMKLTKQQKLAWLECYRSSTVFVNSEGELILGLNPRLVADFSFENIEKMSGDTHQIEKQSQVRCQAYDRGYNKEVYKIFCRCKAVYVATLSRDLDMIKCKYCQTELFPDRERSKVQTIYGEAWITSSQ